MSFVIEKHPFTEEGRKELSKKRKAIDWPVVYLISNDKELYVGETQNAYNRMKQHLDNKERAKLNEIRVVFDEKFNKSAVLDIEQSLIQLFKIDGQYKLQNKNAGQSEKHDYYDRLIYLKKIKDIWNELKANHLNISNDYDIIRNSDIFKYSPYTSLTTEQNNVCTEIINDMVECLSNDKKGVFVIKGGAGTGKTILLINLLYKIINANKISMDYDEETEKDEIVEDNLIAFHNLQEFTAKKKLKVALVEPMTSLQKTIKTVFVEVKNGLKGKTVIAPYDVFKDNYDVVVVDEAHRLKHFDNIGNQQKKNFVKHAKEINKNPDETNQLDMIISKAKYVVIVYDENQSVGKSDITPEEFQKSVSTFGYKEAELRTQMRCQGGEDYLKYLEDIFDCVQTERKEMQNGYEFKMFDDVDEMVSRIKKLDDEYGLCRNAAGYSWVWKSSVKSKKNKALGIKTYDDVIRNGLEDIEIDGHKYVWNMTGEGFILSANAKNEIGCIHTMQGYDLNYVGVIFGKEIDYDPMKNEIFIIKKNFKDKKANKGSNEEIKKYIVNAYKVLMSRGIKGCYMYACNKNLREYLSKFAEKA